MGFPWSSTQTRARSLRVNCFRRFASYWEFITPVPSLLDPGVTGKVRGILELLIKMIAMVVDMQEEWDEHLPFIAMAYQATPHESTRLFSKLYDVGARAEHAC